MATKARAESLKQTGNEYFQKGKLNAAIDMYTEAIVRSIVASSRRSCIAVCAQLTCCLPRTCNVLPRSLSLFCAPSAWIRRSQPTIQTVRFVTPR